MNNCSFVGRFVGDPDLNNVNDTNVVRFTLAINEYRKSKTGEKNKRTDFLDFEAWDSGATTISKYCRKGDEIVVETSARQHKWTDKEGQKVSKVRFRVNRFKLLHNSNGFSSDTDVNSEVEQTREVPI